MDSFSRRHGIGSAKSIQVESMDDNLRIGLWNSLNKYFWSEVERVSNSAADPRLRGRFNDGPLKDVVNALWMRHLKRPIEERPIQWNHLYHEVKAYYFECNWNQVYDFIEFMARCGDHMGSGTAERFVESCNVVMETENSAYRFVGEFIAPIIHPEETAEIEKTLASPYDAVRMQIDNALRKLSERPKPDCRTCIKESISAVETATRLASGNEKGTLGELIGTLKDRLGLHPSQVEGFKKLYGWTCDDDAGIRHGTMDKDDITPDDARYMLKSMENDSLPPIPDVSSSPTD